jgi:serine beta-lactamase-like protein LACTB
MSPYSKQAQKYLIMAIASSVLLLPPTLEAKENSDSYAAAIATASRLSEKIVRQANLPGLSIAVGIEDQLVWRAGFGFADLEQLVPVTPDSKFRIGSVSKTLTASAIGALVERGQLDLDREVGYYVPSFPKKQWPVSVRQLAGHLAGIRSYAGNEFYSTQSYESVVTPIAVFSSDALITEPGTQYQYSTYGWTVVSAAVEAAAGRPFLEFMQSDVLEPLGMVNTIADFSTQLIPNRVRFYKRDTTGRLANAPFVDVSNKWSGGGYLSTPSDLVKFGFDYQSQRHLQPETYRLLTTAQATTSGESTKYGIGWESRPDLHGGAVLGHGGGSVGGTTAFVTWPEHRMVVAVTTNLTEDPGIFEIAFLMGELFGSNTQSESAISSEWLDTDSAARCYQDDSPDRDFVLKLQRTGQEITGSTSGEQGAEFGNILWGREEGGTAHVLVATSTMVRNLTISEESGVIHVDRMLSTTETPEFEGRRVTCVKSEE